MEDCDLEDPKGEKAEAETQKKKVAKKKGKNTEETLDNLFSVGLTVGKKKDKREK